MKNPIKGNWLTPWAGVEPIRGKVTYDYVEEAEQILGYPGAMLSASKTIYSNAHPDNAVYFNACVFNAEGDQIWHGDIDVTKSKDKLQELANKIGKISVTPEHPFRWEGLDGKRVDEWARERVIEFEPES